MAATRNSAHNARICSRFATLDDAMHCFQVLLELFDIAGGEGAAAYGAHALGTLLVRLFVNGQSSLGKERLKASRKGTRVRFYSGMKLIVREMNSNHEFVFAELLLLGERHITMCTLVRLLRL